MHGQIRQSETHGRPKREVSKIEIKIVVLETKLEGDKAQANAKLTNRQTELDINVRFN